MSERGDTPSLKAWPGRVPESAAPDHAITLFQSVADAAPVLLWMADAGGRWTFFNAGWLAFTGRRLQDELGLGWFEGMHPDDRAACADRIQRAIESRTAFSIEYRLRRADGEYRWMLGHGSPRVAADDALTGFVGSSADISERNQQQSAVAEAERRFRRLIENAHDMVYRRRVFPDSAVEYVGGAVQEITGRSPEDFYADANLVLRAIHPDDRHHVSEALRDPVRVAPSVTLRWVHPDGRIVWAEDVRVPVYDATGRLVAIEGIVRGATERLETQVRLRESQEQLRKLAARVEAAREEERAALARELHDELGQTLTAIKLDLARAVDAMRHKRVTIKAVDRLQSLVGLVEIALQTVKRLTIHLRPPALDHLGLAEAIRWEAMAFRSRTGLRCHVRVDRESSALTPEQQTAMFRIFQEALTNVTRHARASAVHVRLVEKSGRFELRIRDNGRGVTEAERADPRAIGLLGMRERAALVGATFDISGGRGKGTLVTVRVATSATPIPRPPAAFPRRPRSRQPRRSGR